MASAHHASGPMDGTLRCLSRMRTIPRASLRIGRLDRGPQRLPLLSGLLLTAVLSVLAAMTLACSSTKEATPTVPAATNPSVTTATATAQTSIAGGLSGTWSGQYSGAFQGTFTLTWQQSGSNLSGTITLSAPAVTLNITGTVEGGDIRFGTVGSLAITYSGSFSGNSMSGTYQTQNVGGPWSATKAS
jgi:hypothetical protein